MSSAKKLFSLILITITFVTITNTLKAEQGDWLVRARGIVISPDDDSSVISLNGAALTGSGAGVDTQVVPELDITYMLTDNIGLELIAAIAKHNVSLEGPGATLSGLGLTDGFGLADTWVLPPTLTVQYHFSPESNIRPYIGAGINYTSFHSEDAEAALEAAIGSVDVAASNSWGWAAQAGVDVDINDKWYFNVDIKYVDINTTATLGTALGVLSTDVDIDPFIIGAGVGLRF